MDWITFASKAIESLSWPAAIVILLLVFQKPLSIILAQLRISRIKHGETEIEMEAADEMIKTPDSKQDDVDRRVSVLVAALIGGAHSYNWIRRNTNVNLSDSEFDSFIEAHNNVFKQTKIIKKGLDGSRIFPGNPGIKLQPSYRERITSV